MGVFHSIFDLKIPNRYLTIRTDGVFGGDWFFFSLTKNSSRSFYDNYGTNYQLSIDGNGVLSVSYVSGTAVTNGTKLGIQIYTQDSTTNQISPLPGDVQFANPVSGFTAASYYTGQTSTAAFSVANTGACTPNLVDFGTLPARVEMYINAAGSSPPSSQTSSYPKILSFFPQTDFWTSFWTDFVNCAES